MTNPFRMIQDVHDRRVREEAIVKVVADQLRLARGWYASSKSVGMRSGPHTTERRAREAMRLSPRARAEQRLDHGTDYPWPHDLLVWRESGK